MGGHRLRDHAQLVKDLLSRFPKDGRRSLPLLEYLHLRMAEALVLMAGEDFEEALPHLRFVLSVEAEVRDTELAAISSFWIGRCLRKEGRYDDALVHTLQAIALARESGYEKMAAIMQVQESWLVFQKGKLKEAGDVLRDAERILSGTDDFVTLGNIQSAYGRIARRLGRYDHALARFEQAIREYKKRDPRHLNLARSLVNMAFVKRLIALQLRRRMDELAALRRSRRGSLTQERARFERLRADALEHLEEANAIYESRSNHRGLGAVHVNYGYLHLDSGELDRAGTEADEAYRQGEEKRDHILKGRARILQCMIENAKYDEQIEESADPSKHAQLAQEFARDAVECARHTQNRRLVARAYIWQGLTFANEFFNNHDAARHCCEKASALLKPEAQDYIWDDLQAQKSKVMGSARIDTLLQEWSEGLVGDKTFQQIAEQFASIVIPKVWEREGRKVARVAEKLSISPKKVRRVLRQAGLLESRLD